ncbi:uncharacterized protein LOC62_03G005111 [Vanrija pseudolonga]|uniref:Secreted protein n=1 Tax=Vanrija pseudolonga TaxID=143232 RepID=A0AAF0YB89_9TREE|nr:hypothetical protein LOC62_03G005111 [Vanrija pseudolonga]
MLIHTLVLALAAIRASAIDCTGADKAKCTDVVLRSLDCFHNAGSKNCTTTCSTDNYNFFVDCVQCELDIEYAKPPPPPYPPVPNIYTGDSYYYDNATTYVRGQNMICRHSVGVPSGAKNISEPPLPAPLPANMVGRPRTCTWVCDQVYDEGAPTLDAVKKCLGPAANRTQADCDTANKAVCNQTAFDQRAACYQCQFSSASSIDWANKTDNQEMARQELDQMVQGCGVLGHNITNRPLYTQWPLPTDPALALSVTAQENIDTIAKCFQCRLSSANKGDFRNRTSDGEQARQHLDEVIQICHDRGKPVSNVPLYTQFPIPSDPALAMHVEATTTYTKYETPTPTVSDPPLTFSNPSTNVTLYSRCEQCSLDKWGDPILAEGPGDSADFAWFDKGYVEFNVACSSAGFPWQATPTLTEPPLKTPLPASMSGRPRSCEWLCANNDQLLIKGRQEFGCKPGATCKNLDELCNQATIDRLGQCAQCRFISANSGDKKLNNVENVGILNEAVQVCNARGAAFTTPVVYTEFPVPTDPAKALQVTATRTWGSAGAAGTGTATGPSQSTSTATARPASGATSARWHSVASVVAAAVGAYLII